MMEHEVTIEPLGITCKVPHGWPLMELLRNYEMEFPCGGNGRCGNCKIRVISGNMHLDESHLQLLEKKGLSPDVWRMACLCKVEEDLVIEIPETGMQIMTDCSSFDFIPEDGYGIAVDLGSTTIVVQLVDLCTGHIVDAVSGVNPQSVFGADIISRIKYALQTQENLDELKNAVRKFIGAKIGLLQRKHPGGKIHKVIISGNTVMHHFFSGYDVAPLAYAPFNSPENGSCSFNPAELCWPLPENCRIEFLPNISHFVGSDIICGIQAVNMLEKDEYSLLIDLGTNGEMVLGNRNELLCTSTAAGPAFEGINISCGMRATTGAVYSVDYSDNAFRYRTIAGGKPAGLCGSGLVEAVCCLLENDLIDFTGAMADENMTSVRICENVVLKIEDIREFQLAKAALAAGMKMLLKSAGVGSEKIGNVYVTGGLGNYLNVGKIKRLGLFNDFNDEQIVKVSNASVAGCRQNLFESNRKKVAALLDKCRFCSLESMSEFQNVFCEEMFFPM